MKDKQNRRGHQMEYHPFINLPEPHWEILEKCFPQWYNQYQKAYKGYLNKFRYAWIELQEEVMDDGLHVRHFIFTVYFPSYLSHSLHIKDYESHFRIQGFDRGDKPRNIWKEPLNEPR